MLEAREGRVDAWVPGVGPNRNSSFTQPAKSGLHLPRSRAVRLAPLRHQADLDPALGRGLEAPNNQLMVECVTSELDIPSLWDLIYDGQLSLKSPFDGMELGNSSQSSDLRNLSRLIQLCNLQLCSLQV